MTLKHIRRSTFKQNDFQNFFSNLLVSQSVPVKLSGHAQKYPLPSEEMKHSPPFWQGAVSHGETEKDFKKMCLFHLYWARLDYPMHVEQL